MNYRYVFLGLITSFLLVPTTQALFVDKNNPAPQVTEEQALAPENTELDEEKTVETKELVTTSEPYLLYFSPTYLPWQSNVMEIDIRYADDSGAGLREIKYCWQVETAGNCVPGTGNGWDYTYNCTGSTCTAPVRGYSEGSYTLCSRAVNNNGTESVTSCMSPFRRDYTAPQIAITGAPVDWVNYPVYANVSCNDPASTGNRGNAGCDSRSYMLAPGYIVPLCLDAYNYYPTEAPFRIDTLMYVCGTGKDRAANPGFSGDPITFKVDMQLPASPPVTTPEHTTDAWNISWPAAWDRGMSGIDYCTVEVLTPNTTTWLPISTVSCASADSTAFTPTNGYGTYKFRTKSMDFATNVTIGNVSETSYDEVQYNYPPEMSTFTPVMRLWSADDVHVSVTYDDDGGMSKIHWCWEHNSTCVPEAHHWGGQSTCSGTSCSTQINGTTEGEFTLCVRGEDATGEMSETTCHEPYKIDRTPPTIAITGAPATWQSTPAVAHIVCDDPASPNNRGNSGCNSWMKFKVYSYNPGTCPTNRSLYTVSSPYTVTRHKWLCATTLDNAANNVYSEPVEFKVNGIVLPPRPVEVVKNVVAHYVQ